MNSFIAPFFTLIAALGGVWLTHHLQNKSIFKSTTKKKAIECYSLANRLMHSLNSQIIYGEDNEEQ